MEPPIDSTSDSPEPSPSASPPTGQQAPPAADEPPGLASEPEPSPIASSPAEQQAPTVSDALPAPASTPPAPWTTRLGRALRHPYFYILLFFLATRGALTIGGVISRRVLEPMLGPQFYLWRYSKSVWLDVWSVWDSGWYLDIAQYGYNAHYHSLLPKLTETGQLNYAFFPLYPMMLRGLGWLIGDYPLAGIILSNVFLLVACVFLYKLVCLSDGPKAGVRAAKHLLLFPVGFILSGVFTESTFLALAIMTFYFARRDWWVAAGITGFFLALTRNVGVILVAPLAYEYLQARSFQVSRIRANILALGLIPLGLGLFMAYNYHLTGDWLGFVHIQVAWHRQLMNPLKSLVSSLRSADFYVQFPAWFVLVVLAMAVFFCRRLGLSYFVLTLMLVLVPLASSLPERSQMPSMPRCTMAAFPLFILLAQITRDQRLDWALSCLLAALQSILMVFWSMGFPLVI